MKPGIRNSRTKSCLDLHVLTHKLEILKRYCKTQRSSGPGNAHLISGRGFSTISNFDKIEPCHK